jgi:hypothetical protein
MPSPRTGTRIDLIIANRLLCVAAHLHALIFTSRRIRLARPSRLFLTHLPAQLYFVKYFFFEIYVQSHFLLHL